MEERYKGGIKTRAKLTVHKLQFFFLDQQAWERYKRQFKPRQDGDEETLSCGKEKETMLQNVLLEYQRYTTPTPLRTKPIAPLLIISPYPFSPPPPV